MRARAAPPAGRRLGRWQRGAPVVRARVRCSGAEHVVVWRRGGLALAHHDLAAEEALAALGGAVPACLDVVRLWRRAAVAASPPDHVYFTGGRDRAEVHLVRFRPPEPTLPEPLRRLRSLTLDEGGPADEEATARRASAAARSSAPGGLGVSVSVAAEPGLRARAGSAHVRVPARWTVNVWARRLEVTGGRFVVDAATRPGRDGRLSVLTLAWDGGEARLEPVRVPVR